MENKPKNLGLNCSTFEDFITGNHIYVDKTKIIYDLITALKNKHFYFVSRPRRFGKSLFISTLKEIFLGRKELFGEYWIGKNSSYNWPKHPVIHLDFGGIEHETADELKQSLCFALQMIAKQYVLEKLEATTPGNMLKELVEQLSKKNKVVLLIDEYDKPIVDHIDNLPFAEKNRKILNSFYATVKSLDAHWRAIFITGVSKFSKTSLFSGLNNLEDLTLAPNVAELFGYTHHDLISYFSADIDGLAHHLGETREEVLVSMKAWYDGYRFCDDMQKPLMYNPLSVVACLKNKKFFNYWFSTGTPGFLIALLRLEGVSLEVREIIQISMDSLEAVDINDIPLFPLLVQTGYLTIVDYDVQKGQLTLDYPNREVRESFKRYLVQAFTYATSRNIEKALDDMKHALKNKNFEQFCNAVKVLFAGIPHNLHVSCEAYYHSLFHFLFDLLGMRPQSEVASSLGKADLILETADRIIVFEFKFNKSAQEALDQINRNRYYEKYMHKNKAIILVGINVDFKDKQLTFQWLEQEV